MIGFYNYTVIVTYLSLISSVIGIFLAFNEKPKWAIMCLAISGLCDMLDGKIARTKKDRTDEEKAFGIQIDSLCDVICFGAFPAILAYSLGMKKPIGLLILCMYTTNAVIRLAYYNVMEEKRQKETSEKREYYSGLPVTTIAILLPIVYLIASIGPMRAYFPFLLHCCMTVVGLLFVVDFKVKKLDNAQAVFVVCVVAMAVLFMMRWI